MTPSHYVVKTRGNITYHKLLDFCRCQTLYRLKYVDEAMEEQDKDVLTFGSAFDCYRESREKFDNDYEVVARRNKDSETVKFKTQLTQGMWEAIQALDGEYNRNKLTQKQELIQAKVVARLNYMDKYPLICEIDKMVKYGEQEIIVDDKTTGSLTGYRSYLDRVEEYLDQLTFYQFVYEGNFGKILPGALHFVSKDPVPKTLFLYAEAEKLLARRPQLLDKLDRMIEAMENGLYESSDRAKCLECEAYGICPFAVQEEYVIL